MPIPGKTRVFILLFIVFQMIRKIKDIVESGKNDFLIKSLPQFFTLICFHKISKFVMIDFQTNYI